MIAYSINPRILGMVIQEAIHNNYDGWSEEEKAVIDRFLEDAGTAAKIMEEMETAKAKR